MRRKKQEQKKKGAPPFMTTYADMITLILVFFILLFSMSQIDITKFKAVVESYTEKNLNFYPSVVPMENPSQSSVVSKIDGTEDIDERPEQPNDGESNESSSGGGSGEDVDQLGHLLNEINEYLDVNGLEDVITANRNERGVVLVLQEKVLFDTAQSTILPSAEPFLDKVGVLLKNIPNPVKVEGHTDDRPISTVRYPSNWELSAARAGSVIRYLASNNELDQKRFTAVGYGETRPVVPNDGPEGWQINRGVEIVISDPDYDENESEELEE